MIDFAREKFVDVLPEMAPVACRNWADSADDHEGAPLAPAWDRYFALEEMGALRLYTARFGGDLVGGAMFTVGKSLHSRDLTLGTCDTIWLAQEHRRGMTGARLLRWAEADLASAGVEKVVISVKPNGVGTLLSRMGYRPVETVFVNRLGAAHG